MDIPGDVSSEAPGLAPEADDDESRTTKSRTLPY
jgi:hypothetical protein